MKQMQDNNWVEVADDADVHLSKEDVLASAGITSRMLTSLVKKGVVAPKAFEDQKKWWFSEADVELIKANATKKTPPKVNKEVEDLKLRVEKLELQLANQKAFILGLNEKFREKIEQIMSLVA